MLEIHWSFEDNTIGIIKKKNWQDKFNDKKITNDDDKKKIT
jgi:hypothetical protein